jgi:hypothetical protein
VGIENPKRLRSLYGSSEGRRKREGATEEEEGMTFRLDEQAPKQTTAWDDVCLGSCV